MCVRINLVVILAKMRAELAWKQWKNENILQIKAKKE